MNELLDKYLSGELTKEQYDAEVEKLSDEDKTKFIEYLDTPEARAKRKEAADKELGIIEARRKERQRIEKDPPASTDFAAKLREENVEKAAKRLFETFSIPSEDQAHYRDVFKQNDSGHVDTDLIFNDFKKIYAAEHSDELLTTASEYAAMTRGAEEFNADQGGAPGGAGAGGSDSGEKYSSTVMEYVKEAAKKGIKFTPKAAKEVLERGMSRTF